MNREKKLVKNTLIISIGKICTQLITFLLLPLYTSVLTTSEYGIVDLLNTLVSLILPVVTFQIEQAVFRELIENRNSEENKKKIISSSITTVVIQTLLFSILFFVISSFINNQYKYYLLMNIIVYIFSSLFLQISRGLGENKKYAFGSFLSAISTILFNVIFLVLINLKANGMLIGTFLGQLACVLYLFVFLKIYKYIDIKMFDKNLLFKLWKYSIPLIPNAISWWIFNASDRLIVSTILGLGDNGILATANKLSAIIVTIYNIFHISWTESMALHIDDKDASEYFNKVMNIILNIFICGGLLYISIMPFAFKILVNEKFYEAYNLIPILVISCIFNVLQGLVAVIYSAKRNTKKIATTSIVAAVLNIVIHFSLIKFIGIYAAVISTLVSFLIIALYRCYDINKKYMTIKFNAKIIASSSLLLGIILFSYYKKNIYINCVILLLTIIYSYIVNAKNINIILDLVKSKISKRKV